MIVPRSRVAGPRGATVTELLCALKLVKLVAEIFFVQIELYNAVGSVIWPTNITFIILLGILIVRKDISVARQHQRLQQAGAG